ncbi:DUF4244 domain-containing protein [Cellulomonas sp. zg-ZUI222]|nr:DUF4244 domain-containing protein [Cellulomonas wangleii]
MRAGDPVRLSRPTVAAVGFAGVLVVVLKGNEVKGLLTGIVRQALGG